MKSRTIRWTAAIVGGLTLIAVGFTLLGQRPVPDASADSLRGKEVRLTRVFKGIPLSQPVWMSQPPGSDHWWVVEQQGRLVTFPDDPKTDDKRTVLDITDRVKFGGEQGLLGLAFHPKWPKKPHLFVNYTSTKGGDRHTRVSRFTRGEDGTVDPGTEKILMKVAQPYGNHNGGQVSFGPDGYLYVAFGDGGLAGDPQEHGQNPKTILGSMVRIDVDGGDPYGIPDDNPFAKAKEKGAPEVYAWGLRNPWRFSFDRKTGKLWAGDVGQNAWEEVDIVERGHNYGWNIREGTHCYDPPVHLKVFGSGECGEGDEGLEPPVIEYSQKNGDRSVTGGYVYRGKRVSSLSGHYVYGDFVSGRIWAFDPKTEKNRLLVDTPLAIASFFEGHDGEVGVLSYGDGAVYRLAPGK